MLNFYWAVIERVLTFSITVSFGSIKEGKAQIEQSCKKCFQNNRQWPPQSWIIVSTAPVNKAILISQDSSHPAHDLFDPLPPSRRFRSIKTTTNRFSSSFFPLAIQALSKQKWFFLLSVVQTYSTFSVYILTYYIIYYFIPHFMILYLY